MGANSYVVKVELEGALRRTTLEGKQGENNGGGELGFSFAQLEGRVRDLFQLPPAAPIGLTYVDRDGDVVTMADDEDLQDALVMQSLNPLRLTATKVGGAEGQVESKSAAPAAPEKVAAASVPEAVPEADAAPKEPAPAGVEAKEPELEKSSSSGMDKTVEKEANDSRDKCKDVHYGIRCDKCNVMPIVGPRFKSCRKADYDLCRSCFESTGAEPKDYKDVHYGIRCNKCKLLPIVGTRFKSCSKANYDLCRPCFESTGAEPNDYVTIDRLVEPRFFGGRRGRNPRNLGCRGGMGMRSGRHPACGAAAANSKKDASTADAKDASSTPVEHKGVQCDECGANPIQGPRFKSATRFNYDVCLACFEKGGSDAAEYHRFDQPLVWPAHPLVPLMGGMFGPIGPMFGYTAMPRCGRRVVVRVGNGDAPEKAEPEKQAEGKPSGENETGKAGKEESQAAPSAPAADEEKQSEVKSEAKPSETKEVGSAPAEAAVPAAAVGEDQNSLAALVAKLGVMGFTDESLSKELLEKNSLDLRKTLDELFSAEEWDPILGDLQEMGFYDEQMNRRLLFKNNGSMKRVVRELVQMDKEKKQA